VVKKEEMKINKIREDKMNRKNKLNQHYVQNKGFIIPQLIYISQKNKKKKIPTIVKHRAQI